jgi:hypothetical protein
MTDIYHIEGMKNLWADLLTLWYSNRPDDEHLTNQSETLLKYSMVLNALALDIDEDEASQDNEDNDLQGLVPNRDVSLYSVQPMMKVVYPQESDLKRDQFARGLIPSVQANLVKNNKGQIMLYDNSLIMRVIVISHCGLGGSHLNIADTMHEIQRYLCIHNLKNHVETLVNKFLHCITVRGGPPSRTSSWFKTWIDDSF